MSPSSLAVRPSLMNKKYLLLTAIIIITGDLIFQAYVKSAFSLVGRYMEITLIFHSNLATVAVFS